MSEGRPARHHALNKAAIAVTPGLDYPSLVAHPIQNLSARSLATFGTGHSRICLRKLGPWTGTKADGKSRPSDFRSPSDIGWKPDLREPNQCLVLRKPRKGRKLKAKGTGHFGEETPGRSRVSTSVGLITSESHRRPTGLLFHWLLRNVIFSEKYE